MKFAADQVGAGKKRPPPAEREKHVGAFGAEFPQMIPAAADSPAVKTKG